MMMIGKRNRSIPWDEIKKAFVEGTMNDAGNRYYPTLTNISKDFGVSKGSIGARCSKEQWAEQREILANKIAAITNEKIIEAISDSGSTFDLACFNVAAKATEILAHKVNKQGPDGFFLIDDLNKLSATLKNLQVVGRMALGLPTDISKSTSQVTTNDVTRMDENG